MSDCDWEEDTTTTMARMNIAQTSWGADSTNGLGGRSNEGAGYSWGMRNADTGGRSSSFGNDDRSGGRSRGRGRGRGRGTRGGNDGCYKCNEGGHMARDCPMEVDSNTRSDRPKGCFRCHEEGHMARDCPMEADSNSRTDRPRGCFNCKEEGHMSRDCPQGGSKCRKCGEEGHFARDCTKAQEECLQSGDKEEKPLPMTYIPVELEDDQLFGQEISAGSNFSAFDDVAVKVSGSGNIPARINHFSETQLRSLLLENVAKAGYRKPTPIQKHSIPIIKSGRDLMGCAQTGSGKTAAFLLPILHYILENNLESHSYENPVRPAALVVSPTRELAIQIFNEARKFSVGSVLKICIVYGGTSVSHQHKGLQRGCHVLVATPGRLLDYVQRSNVSFDTLKFLVLDEADRMLDMGFRPAIDKIIDHHSTPDKTQRQTLMFSATFAGDIQQLAKNFLHDYVFVVTGMVGAANIDVKQTILSIEKSEKRETLLAFIRDQLQRKKDEKILVFVETKRMADFIALYLSSQDVNSTSIHGDRFQNQREEALSQFKLGIRNVLVATAVAARGLDIKGVGIVVNYDMPKEIDEYVHRIGRTGRVGNPGRAISYFNISDDQHLAKSLVKLLSDAEQEVPDWLLQCAHTSGEVMSYRNENFGASDIRKKGVKIEEFPAACAVGGPYQAEVVIPDDEEVWD